MTREEYNRCVDDHADGVFRFILKNLKDEETACDIVQDAFTKMWEKLKDISPGKSKSYLFSTAYHTMIDYIRREKRTTGITDDDVEDSGSAGPDFPDVKEILDMAVSRLPEVQRSVLLLRDYEGYSYNEIGEITGLNESQVKVYIFRARKTMKNYLVSIDKVI